MNRLDRRSAPLVGTLAHYLRSLPLLELVVIYNAQVDHPVHIFRVYSERVNWILPWRLCASSPGSTDVMGRACIPQIVITFKIQLN